MAINKKHIGIDFSSIPGFFERMSTYVTKITGSNIAICTAFLLIFVWLIAGPFTGFSTNWQLSINTGTTVITFLMVFLIQKAQNKDAMAIQLKLNELVAAHDLASNRLIDVENMTEDELKTIQKYYTKLRITTREEKDTQRSHSIDETRGRKKRS
jgi:low affinity Fe/Cu permease